MPRFLAGFLTASLLFGALLFAHAKGFIDINLEPEPPALTAAAEKDEPVDDGPDPQRKKPGKRLHAVATVETFIPQRGARLKSPSARACPSGGAALRARSAVFDVLANGCPVSMEIDAG